MADSSNTVVTTRNEVLALASTIIAAYVSKNPVPVAELPAVMKNVHGTLSTLAGAGINEPSTNQKPAVTVKKSVTPDYIVCLEDGKKLKMLKRYLRSRYKLSPEEYRAKWGLPVDYPMVAPNYSAKRSAFAKQIGLGRTKARPQAKRRRRA